MKKTKLFLVWLAIGSASLFPLLAQAAAVPPPGAPEISAWLIPPVPSGKPVNIQWNLYYGQPGTTWEVWSDNSAVVRNLTPTNNGSNTQLGANNTLLPDGTHSVVVKLCNINNGTKQCTSSAPVSVTVGGVPGKLRIEWMNATQPSAQPVSLSWSLDYGLPGSGWEVWSNGSRMMQSTQFTSQTSTTQTGSTKLNLANGTYSLQVKLCNSNYTKCATSDAVSIKVGSGTAPVQPGTPQVSLPATTSTGSATLSWVMGGAAPNNAAFWQVLDGTTHIYPGNGQYSNQFGNNGSGLQTGTANLSFTQNGNHSITVKTCDASQTLCSTSTPSVIKVTLPPPLAKPTVTVPATSSTGAVTLNWVNTGPNALSWQVLEGTTNIYPGNGQSSTQFGQDGQNHQTGAANLNLANGNHALSVKLCGTGSQGCVTSNSSTVNVTVRVDTPVLTAASSFTNGKISASWGTPGAAGTVKGTQWQLLNNGTTVLHTGTPTDSGNRQTGNVANLAVANGPYSLTVKLCNASNVCSVSNTVNTTVSGGVTPPAGTKRVMAYLPNWQRPPAAADVAAAGYTHLLYSFGLMQPGGGIYVNIPVSDPNQPDQNYIKALQTGNPKVKVLLSIGGASTSVGGTTVYFNQAVQSASNSTQPSADAKAMVQSIEAAVQKYGFDGVDFDIEFGLVTNGTMAAPTGDIAQLAYIINTLHQKNPNLLITLAPQTLNVAAANTSTFAGSQQQANYSALIMQTYSALTWVGTQMYNTGGMWGIDCVAYANTGTSPDFTVAMSVDVLESWPQGRVGAGCRFLQPPSPAQAPSYIGYLSPDQIVLGYPFPDASGGSDGGPVTSLPVIQRAIQCLKTGQKGSQSCDTYTPPKAYGDIGGVFGWNINYDASNHFKYGCTLSGSQSDLCKGMQ